MKVFSSFEKTRKFVQKLKLKNLIEWNQYVKSGNKPEDIPAYPPNTYRDKWISWGDFLGTGTVATQNRSFRDFKSAREFVKKLKLKNTSEWNQYVKSGQYPNDIPTAPNRVYDDKDWISWGDFLGTGKISTMNREYASFKNAREHVRKLNLRSQKEWREYCTSGNKPDNIPSAPERFYKHSWKNTADWLGTGTIATKDRAYLPFKSARKFVRKLKLKNNVEWQKYCKSGNKPNDIPTNPDKFYKNAGWKSLSDWLGNDTKTKKNVSKKRLKK